MLQKIPNKKINAMTYRKTEWTPAIVFKCRVRYISTIEDEDDSMMCFGVQNILLNNSCCTWKVTHTGTTLQSFKTVNTCTKSECFQLARQIQRIDNVEILVVGRFQRQVFHFKNTITQYQQYLSPTNLANCHSFRVSQFRLSNSNVVINLITEPLMYTQKPTLVC